MNKKYDCICTYSHNGIASNRLVNYDRYEIEYPVKSLIKYCSSWLGRIFVVGDCPPDSIKDLVIHIPCNDPYKHMKDANLIHKIRYVIETIPDLSEDFVHFSDDYIITKPTEFEDLKPRVIRKYSDWTPEQWKRNAHIDYWHGCMNKTMKLFKNPAFFNPHIFSPMNKYKFVEMCNKYDYQHSNACIIKTLYYNFVGAEQIPNFDHLHLSKDKITLAPTLTLENIPRIITWTDGAFMQKCFQNLLDKIVE